MEDLGLRLHQWLYVATRGWIGHRLIGVPALLLRTIGRRTGRERINALIYARDGDSFVVVGSNGGRDRSPGWFFNALGRPDLELQIARRRLRAHARAVERGDADYDRLWALVNANNHRRYERYQERTARPIPLLVLTPAAPR